ncbi:hypothetical protein, partial [Clostridium tarantellae]|uniref:hypothetical protein n=1 Tax=Clostridium tarantellae TaxID=39493 RepID=UPI001A9B6EAF
ALMILTLIIFIIIFLVKLILKRKDYFWRDLSIVIKEESKYYNTINMNWEINLQREYEELYYTDSGPTFNGHGERYFVFKYETLDEINNSLEWKVKNDDMQVNVTKILEILKVPNEYYPNYNNNFKYYYKIKKDNSKIYVILDSSLKKLYITEQIL